MSVSFLTIHPHDPVIVRDARPFGFGNRMRSLDWPYPSVLAGSVRTMAAKVNGFEFTPDVVESLKKVSVRGLFAFFKNTLWFPAPHDIVMKKEGGKMKVFPVAPVFPADMNGGGCNLPHPSFCPALIQGDEVSEFKPEQIPPFWSVDLMVSWLVSSDISGFSLDIGEGSGVLDLPAKESRVHTAIDPQSGCAQDMMLFETIGLDFMHKGNAARISLAGRVDDPDNGFALSQVDTLHPFGGKRRIAHWKSGEEQYGWECPEMVRSACRKHRFLRMVLVTPGIFSGGWLPGWLSEVNGFLEGRPPGVSHRVRLRLRSAIVGRWQPVSGWSLELDGKREKGPKAMRRAVPAGSVYFFERVDDAMDGFVQDAWLHPVCDDEQDRRDGFGMSVWGVWNA